MSVADEKWSVYETGSNEIMHVHVAGQDPFESEVCALFGKPEQNEERASLIAAAPDLLRAAKVVRASAPDLLTTSMVIQSLVKDGILSRNLHVVQQLIYDGVLVRDGWAGRLLPSLKELVDLGKAIRACEGLEKIKGGAK